MVTYTDLLPKPTENQQAFILDHGKTEDDGQLKYADDAKSYGWNMRQYGKLKAGAVVLNRHPGKITKDRKWEIYGGGYVESVSDEDENGNVTAVITHAFTIEPPIKQAIHSLKTLIGIHLTRRSVKSQIHGLTSGINTG
ncbi:hypothetical protein ICE98_02420 [Lactococcus lactis]|nr:hypothetical protein [Lactococcus lactis]